MAKIHTWSNNGSHLPLPCRLEMLSFIFTKSRSIDQQPNCSKRYQLHWSKREANHRLQRCTCISTNEAARANFLSHAVAPVTEVESCLKHQNYNIIIILNASGSYRTWIDSGSLYISWWQVVSHIIVVFLMCFKKPLRIPYLNTHEPASKQSPSS